MGAPASLVAQMVNNLPAIVQKAGASILGLEKNPLEDGMATHSSAFPV